MPPRPKRSTRSLRRHGASSSSRSKRNSGDFDWALDDVSRGPDARPEGAGRRRPDDVLHDLGHRDGISIAGVNTYERMQLAIDDGYAGIADELGAPVAPVGFTWFVTRREHPEISMWQDDGSHATASGTYLAACVFYASIFRQSPEGLAFLDGLPSQDARTL